jgi:hypothetical protein
MRNANENLLEKKSHELSRSNTFMLLHNEPLTTAEDFQLILSHSINDVYMNTHSHSCQLNYALIFILTSHSIVISLHFVVTMMLIALCT